MSGWHSVVALQELPEGRPVEANVSGVSVLLIRVGSDVFATQPHCPHKFGNLADGTLHGTRLTCPQHTATFDLATGRPQPGEDWAGTLSVYPTRVREGQVEVQIAAIA